MIRCGKLRHIFDSDHIPLNLKIRLYIAAVCSLLTYGMETWSLNPRTLRRLNGANSRMLSRITGKSIQDETRATTTTFNLTLNIRRRRFKWVGKILRDKESRLVFQMLVEQQSLGFAGNLLMDTPPNYNLDELRLLAINEQQWNLMAGFIT